MRTTTVKSGWAANSNHYYRCHKPDHRVESCPNRKNHRADKVEPRVWQFVSALLTEPERLRAGLEEMITRERKGLRGDPDQEAKVWANKLVEVDRKRARFQDMAAEGLIEFDELRARLASLEETRETARRELAALEGRRQRLAELEHDRDVLIESYAGMVPEALTALSPRSATTSTSCSG